VRPRRWPHDTAPIDVVVLPRLRRDVQQVQAHRVSGVESMLSLLRFPRFPGLVEPAVHEAQLGHVAALAARVPVAILDVPWGVGPSVALGESIRQHVERVLESSVLA
jgi:hypothetical protein